jgi:protein Mpv17
MNYVLTISSNLLLKRPLATQCVTSAILFASGDIIAQQAIERKQEKHDVRVTHYTLSILTYFSIQFSRTARLTFFGGDP